MKTSFVCSHCSEKVFIKAPGTQHRNHCPKCLWSKHVDQNTGDRRSVCNGGMEPIGKVFKKDGEEVLVHRCLTCEFVRKNRIAGDDDFKLVENLNVLKELPC